VRAVPTATVETFDFGDPVIVSSSSLSLIVDDPSASLAELERLVTDAGGYISSSSSWSDPQSGYASLSAEVPPEVLAELRSSAIERAVRVSSNSLYSQDVTSEVEELERRLASIDEAESRLLDILLGSDDPALAKSYVLIAQLFDQDRQNTLRQLDSYHEQSRLASFDVSLNRDPILIELSPRPAPTPYLQ
jgi:hypothetical protein